MHSGHPCDDIGNDYFKDGITNGAHWYSVSGIAVCNSEMSRLMGKPTICICENKGADQLCSNCEADQRL